MIAAAEISSVIVKKVKMITIEKGEQLWQK